MTPTDTTTAVATLEVRNLSAGYGPLDVIHDVSFAVHPGETVGLLGRNGAGKTTTLMAIAGYLARTAGDVLVNGKQLTGPAFRRTRTHLAVVLEGRSVFPSLTVGQNLTLSGADVDEALALFPELERRRSVKAGLLSGGEQQMLALGRALCRHPEVLLIDELSFGLAPVVCARIFERLGEAAEATNVATLLVEQSIHYAAMVVDRALIVNEGEIRLEMAGSELHEREAEIEQIYLGGPKAPPATS